MGTRPSSGGGYHTCTCGETFETTRALLEHAREDHGIAAY